jgi:hypothetical protein
MPITITTKGWITLHRDGALISQHTVESKAIEAALEHAEANGGGDYELRFPNKVLRVSLLSKTAIPFRWSPITVSLTAGTATSVNVAQYLNNPEGRPITFTASGSLPTGATLSSAGLLTYDGNVSAASASVQFVATSGDYVAESSATTVNVAPPPLQNTAPVFSVAPATVNLPSNGGTIQFTAVDPQGDAVSYSLPTTRTGITINASTGLVTVTSSAAGTAGSIVARASDGSLTADATCSVTVSAGVLKWHPGHYALTQANDSQATKFSLFDELGSGWQGAQVRYYWGNVETAQGVYDWSVMRDDRDRLFANGGKRLWVQFLTTRFGSFSSIGPAVPTYMQTPAYNGGAVIAPDRVIAQLWTPAVMDRYIALCQAFAAEFDDDDSIAGMNAEETAVGPTAPLTPYGYTGTAMYTQMKRMVTETRSHFVRTPMLTYANFFPGWSSAQIQDFFEHLEAEAVAVGGPDNNPDEGTTGKSYYTGAIGTQDYRGTLPAGFANQRESTRDYPFADLYDYAVNTLEMNWMFTLKNTIDSNTSWANIKTFVDANPDMVATLPTVYQ